MSRAIETGVVRADVNRKAVAPKPWFRRKGNIAPLTLFLLIMAACLPLLLALARLLALPGADLPAVPGIEAVRDLGRLLNRWLTLQWVPPGDRPEILYLVLLPTGALLIAIARLTFGIQVLGLRAILIAIAFQEIGFVPSLALMAVVIGVVAAVRPSIRRIRLPLYARITVILCIVAAIMVAALLIAPWLNSEAVWSVAFFPVIIMAMVAEGIARTLASDDAIKAIWRLGWTISLALLIAVIGQIAVVGTFALQFPELILTQLVAIVFVSEFLDLRLLEDWPARLSRYASGMQSWYRARPRLVIVRNRPGSDMIGRHGRRATGKHRRRSVQPAVDAMRAAGFDVRVVEGDVGLLRELRDFLPYDRRTGAADGLVLNLATGVQGAGRSCQVPALLEMAGVAYTGPDPVAHAHLLDRYVLFTLLREAGVRVPRFALCSDAQGAAGLRLPMEVGARFGPDVAREPVSDQDELVRAVADIVTAHCGPALVEECPPARQFRIALIGNETIECLPVLERVSQEHRRWRPAVLDEKLAARIRGAAQIAYVAAGCRDYARVDVRLDVDGAPVVIEVDAHDLLDPRGSFARAAEASGYSFAGLMRRIVEVAALRYRQSALAKAPSDTERSVLAFDGRGAAPKQQAGHP